MRLGRRWDHGHRRAQRDQADHETCHTQQGHRGGSGAASNARAIRRELFLAQKGECDVFVAAGTDDGSNQIVEDVRERSDGLGRRNAIDENHGEVVPQRCQIAISGEERRPEPRRIDRLETAALGANGYMRKGDQLATFMRLGAQIGDLWCAMLR